MISISEIILSEAELRYILKRVSEKKADFNDTFQYAKILSHTLGNELSDEILTLEDPEIITAELLRSSYEDINSVCADVQKALDERISVNLKPQKSAFPAERVRQFAHSLIDPTVSESVIKRRARTGTTTISMSFHDDYISENAKFRQKLGLDCYITRIGSHCCEWCTAVSGKYAFGEQPADIFRRHDNCDCVIIYDNKVLRGKQRDGGTTRAWEETKEYPKDFEPLVLSQEQAKTLENRNLRQFRGLTDSGESGIIETENQKRLRKMIENGDVTLEINKEMQNRHYKGTREYNELSAKNIKKSYFNIPQSELQEFLKENATHGNIKFDKNGNAREIFYFKKNIAYDTKIKKDTSYATVHYSKKRTHFSPYTPKVPNEGVNDNET